MNLSVVIQGPILPFTKEGISSVRKCFPGSEVILSTWNHEDVSGLEPDKVVQLEDPGPGLKRNNAARQIIGSLAGLREAKNEMAMRTRSDAIFLSPGCMDHWGKYPKRVDDFRIFKERLVVPNIGTCDPENHCVSLQVTEWAILGLLEDLVFLYDIPPFEGNATEKSLEQYLWISAIQKKMPEIDVPYLTYNDDRTRDWTRRFMANNVVILNTFEQYRMYCGKWKHVPDDEAVTMKHAKWRAWYDAL